MWLRRFLNFWEAPCARLTGRRRLGRRRRFDGHGNSTRRSELRTWAGRYQIRSVTHRSTPGDAKPRVQGTPADREGARFRSSVRRQTTFRVDILARRRKNIRQKRKVVAMNNAEAIRIVADVLAEIQSISGRVQQPIREDTRPIGDLDQFDSLNGVEATVELSDRLGVDLWAVNAFVNESGSKALTVSEIAGGICRLIGGKELFP